jgi:uncharacterized protein (TIGR04255 family)
VKGDTLERPPLVEAIFEIKWQLHESGPGFKHDPHYNLLVGRLYDRLEKYYPFHESLPNSSIPAEIIPGVVQHRFRAAKDKWPVVQLGPGIFTVNDTQDYSWEDFKSRVLKGVRFLFDVHPGALVITNLVLRYINAIDFDFNKEDVFRFLEAHMKTEIALYPLLFENPGVQRTPESFDFRFTFACNKPDSTINLRFARGKKKRRDAFFWETFVATSLDDIPELPSELEGWLENSHNVLEDWFFKLVEGDLLRRFEEC